MSFIPPPKSFPITTCGQRGGNQEVVPGGASVIWRISISTPQGQNRAGGKFFFFKSVFFSPAFFNTCSFSWYRQGLSPNPCPHPARGQTHLLPGHTVLQQQQVCEDAFMNSAVKMQSNAS